VTTWARGRLETEPTLRSALALADAMRATIARLGRAELTRIELRRLCDELEGPGSAPGEAGLAAVPRPGAVLGPARVIVWWGFSRDRAPLAARLRLSAGERAALLAAGVTPPDPGALMEAEAS